MALQPLHRASLRDQVGAVLARYIAANGLEAGDKLPTERELSQGMAVSRTVVREALSSLEARGWVERRTSLGYFVTAAAAVAARAAAPAADAGRALIRAWEARVALEVGIVPVVMRHLTPAALDALEAAAREIDAAMARQQAHAEAELAFHLRLFELTDNPLLLSLAEQVMGDYFRALAICRPGNFARPNDDQAQRHVPLVLCLCRGDIEAAQRAIWQHCALPAELVDALGSVARLPAPALSQNGRAS